MATTYNFAVDQGSPFKLDFLVKNADLSNKDLNGYTARMQFRTSYASPVIRLDATTENDKLVINTAASLCSVVLSGTDTAALSGCYVYDVDIVDSGGSATRIVQGEVKLNPEVTR